MRLVIATPLYPPDTAYPARYAQELAKRLAVDVATTVLAYASIPEKAGAAQVCAVSKRLPKPLRIFWFTLRLILLARTADALVCLNGSSVELPVLVASALFGKKTILIFSDPRARHENEKRPFRKMVGHLLLGRAVTLDTLPPERPEILPFTPRPTDALHAYEESWAHHIQDLRAYIYA